MQGLINEIERISSVETHGRVVGAQGLLVEIAGPLHAVGLGSRVCVDSAAGPVACEVVGFQADRALAMPFGRLDGIRMGGKAIIADAEMTVRPSAGWLGRVVNAMGEPIDGKGPLQTGTEAMPLRARAIAAHERERVGKPIDLGVRSLNTFTTCCRGQRMGIFAGSGVGKSVLLAMIARNTDADVTIVGLVGERGREVQEFIEDNLGEEGLKRAIVVVATSDEPALMRRQAGYLTLTLAEYFRDQGSNVLCLMDSVTRFAQAQREIGLAAGEPPTSKGYTPTVFSELPRLLERAGPGRRGSGSITGLFTVLVEGDNHNEPIADAVRSILDGHIVMDRAIAERGRFPAVDVLRSISRTMPNATVSEFRPAVIEARRLLSVFGDMEELIRLGAYRRGSDPQVDEAIRLNPDLEDFLRQDREESSTIADGYSLLAGIVGGPQRQ
jgi:flagellum-specific ATP synthase